MEIFAPRRRDDGGEVPVEGKYSWPYDTMNRVQVKEIFY